MDKEEIVNTYRSSRGFFPKAHHEVTHKLPGDHFPHMPHGRRKIPARILAVGFLLLLAVAILIPVVTYIFFARDIYDKARLMNRNNVGITLLDRNSKPFFAFYQPKNESEVPISEIPESVQHAVVAIEDKDFYTNPGFSIRGIGRAVFTDISSQKLSQGGSTITQQLVKNLLLNSSKNPIRKYQEIVLAIEIDRVYSKNDILEMYLNSVYFGEGAFGIEDAAQTYFNKPAKNLTLAESALLAGLLQAPSATSPISNDPTYAKQRQQLILDQMLQQGYISKSEETQAINQRLVYAQKEPEDINVNAPHFALMVKDFLAQKFGGEDNIARSGMVVQTTLNLDYQKYAENVVLNQVNSLRKNKVSNGAAVAIDPQTGQVLALVGSKAWADEDIGKFNVATATRQPGSAMKPIVFGAALEKRIITPATLLDDKPTDFGGGYKPKDYDGKYRGQVTVRRALSNSLNIPAVEVLQKLGVDAAVSKGKQMGLTTLGDPSDYGLALVLGAGDVRLIDLTAAYGAFATYGTWHDPAIVLSVKDKNGSVIYSYHDDSKDVLSPEASFLISSILSDEGSRAEEFGGTLNTSHHAAVKTGTTENFRDAWTMGYTPKLVVGAWVGNNDGSPMDNIAGSLGAAPIFRQLMDRFLVGTPVETFKSTGNVVYLDICTPMGSPQPSASPTQFHYREYFISGTQPNACPTPSPVPSPSQSPSNSPTSSPTQSPSPSPSTPSPTPSPSPSPSNSPITFPSNFPSVSP
jgi:1A family penicillin-binding protein